MSSLPVIETTRLVLHLPGPEAAEAALAYVTENRVHLAPWEPTPGADFFTVEYWRSRLQRNQDELREDRGLRLMLRRREDPDGAILGVANFSQFWRGPFQACYLGYSLAAAEQGKGLMVEALRPAIRHVFDELAFHRIMANHMPENERSRRLLSRLGFTVEGFARQYLHIDGAWRDHVLTSLTNPRWEA